MTEPFECPLCHSKSHNPTDIAEGYCGECQAFTGKPVLTMYVIYEQPSDFPHGYVTRQSHVYSGKVEPVPGKGWTAASLEGARAWVPEGLVRLDREPTDDPILVEVWT